MNEQDLCKKRVIDLSKQANRKGIVLFSDFLNLNEQTIYRECLPLLEGQSEMFGGVAYAERQMIAFLPDALYYTWEYPITAIKIEPAYPKFAEKLTHRDYLGALMNLGVDRAKIGDIILEDTNAYLLCEESIAPYFLENLEKIKHTLVKRTIVSCDEISITQKLTEKEGIITSNRLDSIIACVYKLSRSKTLELLRQEKVFINGKLMQNPAYHCKKDEIISVRGFGRFIYQSDYGETGKGRLKIRYQLYEN